MKKGERTPEQQEKFEVVKRLLAAGGYTGKRIAEIAGVSPMTFVKYKVLLGYPLRDYGRRERFNYRPLTKRGRVRRKFPVPARIGTLRDSLVKAFLAGNLTEYGKLCADLQHELDLLRKQSTPAFLEAAE